MRRRDVVLTMLVQPVRAERRALRYSQPDSPREVLALGADGVADDRVAIASAAARFGCGSADPGDGEHDDATLLFQYEVDGQALAVWSERWGNASAGSASVCSRASHSEGGTLLHALQTVALAAITAAVVSAVVTLAIEWFAKPRLEARKERIMRTSKAKGEIGRALRQISTYSGRVRTTVSTATDPDLDKTHERLIEEFVNRSTKAYEQIEDSIIELAEIRRHHKGLIVISYYQGFIFSYLVCKAGQFNVKRGLEASQAVDAVTRLTLAHWATPRWRWLAIRKSRVAFEKLRAAADIHSQQK